MITRPREITNPSPRRRDEHITKHSRITLVHTCQTSGTASGECRLLHKNPEKQMAKD
jgi:hypothetical protein